MIQLSIRLFAVFSSLALVVGIVQFLGWTALLICPAFALATLVFSTEEERFGNRRNGKPLRLNLTVPGAL